MTAMSEHVCPCCGARIERKLDRLLTLVQAVLTQEKLMSAELDNLKTQVAANTSAEQSAVLLLGRLGDLIRSSVNDPAALTKLANDLDASKQQLAAAVTANTPAAP